MRRPLGGKRCTAVVRVYQHPAAPERWQALRDGFIRSLRATGARID